MRMQSRGWIVLGSALLACQAARRTHAQDAPAPAPLPASTVPVAAADVARPLPPLGALMLQLGVNEKAAESSHQDYIFRESSHVDALRGDGSVKKTSSEEHDLFWLDGVVVRKLIAKDGKELTPDEKKKEDEQLDKDVARARERKAKASSKGEETDPGGFPEVTVSRLLELGSFSNERREVVSGRDTLLVDFVGDPKAKTRNVLENAVHEMAGTVWIDEQDTILERVDGRFVNDFKLGGGLLARIKKGTSFSLTWIKVNGEVWLPATLAGSGEARVALFLGFDGRLAARYSDYRKFGAKSTILPGFAESAPVTPPADPAPAVKPQ